MKLRTLFAPLTLSLAIGLTTAPVHAQSIDPCTVYTCMAGLSGFGASGGPGCSPAVAYWHAPTPAGLAVYAYGVFVPPASYTLRRSYLTTGCPAASFATNAAILEAIMTEWGSVP